jgi:zona occludens toxin (predicted ATPase)
MITLYSGTPGSGKSLNAARKIKYNLKNRKKTVIANFPINTDYISRKGKSKIGEFIYKTNEELDVPFIKQYAMDNHRAGKESQSLIVIDEAGIMFNSRTWEQWDRMAWIKFFMTHRHYGYDIILISQVDRLIDRQIRAFLEFDIKHRKANNFKNIGLLLTLFGIHTFAAVKYLYSIREKCSVEFFRYRKRDSKLYDTMMLFDGSEHGTSIKDLDAIKEPEQPETPQLVPEMHKNRQISEKSKLKQYRKNLVRKKMTEEITIAKD